MLFVAMLKKQKKATWYEMQKLYENGELLKVLASLQKNIMTQHQRLTP